ncbi:hypothetical protein DPMN_142823 [Dreissena polymorpha]|uniref:Uncharacterized protein n=1 Tax=Dreissena polymorpha TaxID=45954 RepID=A0A9D4GG15_DREPO|nr:hypothetical protein DPMN_142816 [Dreissena polymorpha]KAH3814327.1 hypothetical protein DPMN_142823 [Dreissena polymorpha]
MAPIVLVVFEGTRRLYSSAILVDSAGGHSSATARLVGCTSQNGTYTCTYTCTSGNTPPGKYVLKHTVTGLHTHILLGIHFQGNACHLHNHRQLTDSHTQSQTHLYLLGMAFQVNTC